MILTDASADGERHVGVGVGAVLHDPESGAFRFLQAVVTTECVDSWRVDDQEQIIFAAELAACPLALTTWAHLLEGRDVILFLDNDAAKDALARGPQINQRRTSFVLSCAHVPRASRLAFGTSVFRRFRTWRTGRRAKFAPR